MGNKQFDNHLGIIGWLGGGRWGVERYLYILHRLTGLGILMFFLLHIFASSVRMYGPESWNVAMVLLKNPIFKLGEFFVFVAFAFHALNGIRLIFIELGLAVGKAEEPIFPYKSSLNNQKPLMMIVMVICAILILAGGYNTFFGSH
ncbi:MAG: succinate dehydrogenase, cytochrome b556 subunit [Deltaproteobacteria bacterium]|jgi:succinate dehydrogenase / fumarate reductase cytochrome b subunit|nr:succinate dehydrogenase, cytochrome b556 subunit [Deltaproteobacteria bacterium]